MKKDLALTALRRALAVRQPPPGLIHPSDRGSQYCSGDYRKLLADHSILASMSGKGNCYDNAIGRYIGGFYNPVRRHSALGSKSPYRFEAEAA